MQTFFAPAERASAAELERDVAIAGKSPVIDALLSTVGGLLAVLNEQRQILLVNDAFLQTVGIEDPKAALGLRPGEAVDCAHARETEGGCGTSRHCTTCGAAISIVVSLASEIPVERRCVLTVERGGRHDDLCLSVRATVLPVDGRRFVLLFLQDITLPQRRAALERAFFHDVSNLITGLQASSELMGRLEEQELRSLALQVRQLVSRLADEVAIQKVVLEQAGDYQLVPQQIYLDQIVQEVTDFFAHHPAAAGKRLRLVGNRPGQLITTDPSLLLRVLGNMLTNAFEGTVDGEEVLWWVEAADGAVTFSVWNAAPIPLEVGLRVFQRNFTTKPEPGRGLGTFSMKLLGEQFLGGEVGFTSSPEAGTIFRFHLPV